MRKHEIDENNYEGILCVWNSHFVYWSWFVSDLITLKINKRKLNFKNWRNLRHREKKVDKGKANEVNSSTNKCRDEEVPRKRFFRIFGQKKFDSQRYPRKLRFSLLIFFSETKEFTLNWIQKDKVKFMVITHTTCWPHCSSP